MSTPPSAEAVTITRELPAPLDLVWRAHTESDRLKQWAGPKGMSLPVYDVDLRPGGSNHYCMLTPGGLEMWGLWTFQEIEAPHRLVYLVSFSDKDRGLQRHPMSDTWPLQTLSALTLSESAGGTTVSLSWSPVDATPEEVQTFFDARASIRGGVNGMLDQLDGYLAKEQANH